MAVDEPQGSFSSRQTADSPGHATPSIEEGSGGTVAAIESLPNELLTHIFSYLDAPAPSTSALYDEPTFLLTSSSDRNVKACSSVSKRWRQAILPLLFKHAQFILTEPKIIKPNLSKQIQPFFNFLSMQSLYEIVESFTLIIHDKKIAQPNGVSMFWQSVFEHIEPSDLTIIAPPEAMGTLTTAHVDLEDIWSFDCPCQYLHLERPMKISRIASISEPFRSGWGSSDSTSSSASTNPLGDSLPLTSTDHGSPLTSTISPVLQQVLGDYSDNQEAKRAESTRRHLCREPPTLFEIRPWTTLLLNEGSFIRAYATSEYWLRRPPSILPDLIRASPYSKHLMTSTIRDMSYVAMFPFSAHYRTLVEHFPKLDRLYTQIVPRNDSWKDNARMKNIEPEDLWCERNSCYSAIMRELFNSPLAHNYKSLLTFESGDAADEDAWAMAVEYMKRANNGWVVEKEGVFVKHPEKSLPDANGNTHAAFEGALTRWAFNGITKLPVSAYPLYE